MEGPETACFEKLAPEVKAFLSQLRQTPQPAISSENYQTMRQFLISTVKNIERPRFSGTIEDRTIPGPRTSVPVRIYRPESARPLPLLLYFHGGGWVLGNLDTEEDTCIALARQTPCIAVSVEYALAPEHPYPAGRDDCYAALLWASEQGQTIGADGRRIAVAGESAGANLATVLAMMARDLKGPAIAFQALFYPATNLADDTTRSKKDFGEGFFLTLADMEGATSLYVPDGNDRSRPYVSPLCAHDLSGLPPAFIVTAGCDPLRDEGEAYGARLSEAGVKVKCVRFDDMIHAFLLLFKRSESRLRAVEMAALALRDAFAGAP